MFKVSTGFTLLELLVTLALVIMLSTIAIPGWLSWMQTTETAVEVNQLVGAINFARSEAIKHNSTMSICQSVDGARCSGTWNDGYIVFSNKDKLSHIGNNDNILQVFQRTAVSSTLYWHNSGILHINGGGMMIGSGGHFTLCPTNKDPALVRAVIISPTGRVRVSKQVIKDCR